LFGREPEFRLHKLSQNGIRGGRETEKSLNSRVEKSDESLRILDYGRKIIEEVMSDKYYAAIYRIACEELKLKDSVEVAISVVRLPLNWKLSRLRGLLGLTPHKGKNIITSCVHI